MKFDKEFNSQRQRKILCFTNRVLSVEKNFLVTLFKKKLSKFIFLLIRGVFTESFENFRSVNPFCRATGTNQLCFELARDSSYR